MHQGVAGQEAVEPPGVEARIVAEALRQTARNTQGNVVFLAIPYPVPVAVAHEAVPHGETGRHRLLENSSRPLSLPC